MEIICFAFIFLTSLWCNHNICNGKSIKKEDLTIIDLLIYQKDHVVVTYGSELRCVGILINPYWVLTTSYCVHPFKQNLDNNTTLIPMNKLPGASVMKSEISIAKMLDFPNMDKRRNNTVTEYVFETDKNIPATLLASYICNSSHQNPSLLLIRLTEALQPPNSHFAILASTVPQPGTKCIGFGLKNIKRNNYLVYNENNGTGTMSEVPLEIDRPRKCSNFLYKVLSESPKKKRLLFPVSEKLIASSSHLLPVGSPMMCDGVMHGISAKVFLVHVDNAELKIYNAFFPLAMYTDWIRKTISKYAQDPTEFIMMSSSENIHNMATIFILVVHFYLFIMS